MDGALQIVWGGMTNMTRTKQGEEDDEHQNVSGLRQARSA